VSFLRREDRRQVVVSEHHVGRIFDTSKPVTSDDQIRPFHDARSPFTLQRQVTPRHLFFRQKATATELLMS
jgi:hypothetical protein